MADYSELMKLEKKPQPPLSSHRNDATPPLETHVTSKLVNQQASLLVQKQTSSEVKKPTSQLANFPTSREVNQQGSKLLKKFGSYLPPETIKSLKRYAFENDQEVYEVLKEAIDLYLEQKQK
jgi:hypothetical protein